MIVSRAHQWGRSGHDLGGIHGCGLF